jgi:hypothetical protein
MDIDYDLVCPICSNLLLDPLDCMTCDSSFCQLCITDYRQRQIDPSNCMCPLGCPQLNLKSAHKKTKQTLNMVQVSCRFEACSEVLTYGEVAEHEF